MQRNENCSICKNYIDFEIPKPIIESIHDVVLFIGAGVSTENKSFFSDTLYDTICDEINIVPSEKKEFPKVMSKYCQEKGERGQLLNRIKERFDYFEAWPELYDHATMFHRELGKLPCIENIITTNWDDYFERETRATPFITNDDIVFWDQPGKRVLKIHGSINNLGSIVATEEDYKKSYRRLQGGIVGNLMKLFLAKNIIIFIGYSFNDYDFRKIYKGVLKEMKSCKRPAYIITPDKEFNDNWKKLGLIPIYTDGFYFIHKLREFFEKRGCLLSLNGIEKIAKVRNLVLRAHTETAKRYNIDINPEIIYTLSYQDGFLHAIGYLVNKISWGYSLCQKNLSNAMKSYNNLVREYKSKYIDHAYLKGYLNGLICFSGILNDAPLPINIIPLYYNELFEREYSDRGDFEKSLRKKYNGPKRKLAIDIIKKKKVTKGLVLHHIPKL